MTLADWINMNIASKKMGKAPMMSEAEFEAGLERLRSLNLPDVKV